MALIHVTYYSQALSGQNEFYAVLPNDVPPMMAMMGPVRRPKKCMICPAAVDVGKNFQAM